MKKKFCAKEFFIDLFFAIAAGVVVGVAYYFFQNSNGFAPGGVGGLATITYHYVGNNNMLIWSLLMVSFNLPIFILVSALINKKLGFFLSIYLLVQSFLPKLLDYLNVPSYSLADFGEDFNVIFACIATGVISGFGFSLMLRHFGASGGTYGISALIKRAKPDLNVAVVSFIMDASVVFIAFFVYGMKVTPVMCTLINLFIANVVVDKGLGGIKDGYKFEIITSKPDEIADELMRSLKHGVTSMKVEGMYAHSERYMLVCIINKRQIGEMMKIIKKYPDTFASFEKVNEVFGNFKRKV